MRRTIAAVGIALAVGAWAGCGAARANKYYALDLPVAAPAPVNTYPATLLVGRISAPHLYRDTRIVYRHGATQMGAYEYHRWAEPPTDMLEALLVRLLRASGKYRSVQPLRSNARGDYILRGRLHSFEEVSDGSLVARIALEVELFDQKTGTAVWTHFYSHDEPVNGKTVAEVVEAMNRNVRRGLGEVTADLDNYFAKNPPK